jgi:hypothetical protein
MTAFDVPHELNVDALLETIYAIQTDLTERLAIERNPELSDCAILDLAYLQARLQQSMPSMRRH